MLNSFELMVTNNTGFGVVFASKNLVNKNNTQKHDKINSTSSGVRNQLKDAKQIDAYLREANIKMNGEYLYSPRYYDELIKKYYQSSKNIPDIDNNQYQKPFAQLSIDERSKVVLAKIGELKRKRAKAVEWEKKAEEIITLLENRI